MSDSDKFEWEASYGSAHFRVVGLTDNEYVRGLITHGQEFIAAAQEAGDDGDEDEDEDDDQGLGAFLTALQGAGLPIRIGQIQGPSQGVGEGCPAEQVMDIVMTLGRNGWKLDIETNEEEECWVVTAQHKDHGLTRNKDEHLFTALVQTGEELRQFVKQADA